MHVLPSPTDAVDEPVFINAKHYHGILKHTRAHVKAESEKKLQGTGSYLTTYPLSEAFNII